MVRNSNQALAAPAAIYISAKTIKSLAGAQLGERVDGLVWQGGVALSADHEEFGEISGISFLDANRFVMVSDKGYFVSGEMSFGGMGEPTGLADVVLTQMAINHGLGSTQSVDAEAVAIVFEDSMPTAVRVGFERDTRVADFPLLDRQPASLGSQVDIPTWLASIETNETIEAICIAPKASPMSGATLVIVEGVSGDAEVHAAVILGDERHRSLGIESTGTMKPSACVFLPDGDLLVLLRSKSEDDYPMQIKRISANHVRPQAILDGPTIFDTRGVGNMEGMGIRWTKGGDLRLVLVSDSGSEGNAENVLLQFSLPVDAQVQKN